MVRLPGSKGIFVLAFVLSLTTALLVHQYLGNVVSKEPMTAGQTVIMAKTAIAPKTKITPDMVEAVKIPAEYVQKGSVSELTKVIGVMSKEKIAAGEYITESRLLLEAKSMGFTGVIPAGKRAVTMAVNEVTGIAGFVKAGDFVDVVVVFDAGTVGDNVGALLLENVLVLAANRETENGVVETSAKDAPKEAVKMGTVTLAIDPADAAKLALAEEKGKIRLALRPYIPGIETTGGSVITPKDLVGVQNSPVQNKSIETAGTSAKAEAAPLPRTPAAQPADKAAGGGIPVIRGTKADVVSVR